MESTGGVIARSITFNLLVHLVLGGLGFAALEFVKPSVAVNPNFISILTGAAIDMTANYGEASGDAMTVLYVWWGAAIGGSLIVSSSWLILADLTRPTSPAEARSALPAWFGFFVLGAALIAAFGVYYLEFHRDSQLQLLGIVLVNAQKVRPQLLMELIAAGIAASALSYFLGTAIGVKRAMRPSVPLAGHFIH